MLVKGGPDIMWLDQLFKSLLWLTKTTSKLPISWLFVWVAFDSHHWTVITKGPVMWKTLLCHDVIIIMVWVERIRALLTMLTMLNHFSITAHHNNNLICNFYLLLTYHFVCHIHCPLEICRECSTHTCPWALWYSPVIGWLVSVLGPLVAEW